MLVEAYRYCCYGVGWYSMIFFHIPITIVMFSCIIWNMASTRTVSLSRSLIRVSVITTQLYGSSTGASCSRFYVDPLMLFQVFYTLPKDCFMVSSWSSSLCMMVSMFCVWCLVLGLVGLQYGYIGDDCGCWMVLIMVN